MTAKPTEFDLYMARGTPYEKAWEIMRAALEAPPSLEVFEHALHHERECSPHAVMPERMAEAIARMWRPRKRR